MSPRKPQMNYKHGHPNQKGKNYTNIKQPANQRTAPAQHK